MAISLPVKPLSGPAPTEVPLANAPLIRVVAQIRFPQILAIRNPDRVAGFQESIRSAYPILKEERVHHIILGPGGSPSVQEGKIWRFKDQDGADGWRVSLGVDYVALETTTYTSRKDFLARLNEVLTGVENVFKPAEAQRLGLRYIDRITDSGLEKIGELIRPKVLGICDAGLNGEDKLSKAAQHVITEAQFLAEEGHIQSRWGMLPPNITFDPEVIEAIDRQSFLLDFDMFSTSRHPFVAKQLTDTATSFAMRLYAIFREMVTDKFLTFYGGKA